MKIGLVALSGVALFLLVVISRPTDLGVPPEISSQGFVPVSIEMNGSDMVLTGGCRSISMTISEHQAISIASGLNKEFYIRPLPHPLIKDIFLQFST